MILKVIDMVQQSHQVDGHGIQQFQTLYQAATCGIQLTEFHIHTLVPTVLTVDIHLLQLWPKRKILKVTDTVQQSQQVDGAGIQLSQIPYQVAICGEMLTKSHIQM